MNASITVRFPAQMGCETEPKTTPADPAGSARTQADVSDEALMARMAEGDKGALGQLFQRYAALIRRMAQRVLRDASEAEDLAQEIFLAIQGSCSKFDPAKSPARFWILRMTYHRAISRRRHLDSRHFYTHLDLDDPAAEPALPLAPSRPYEDSLDAVLGNGALERIFQSLSENQRRTLRLFFQEGHTLDEIATELGQSRENVKHHYFRGLDKLRKEIFGDGFRTK